MQGDIRGLSGTNILQTQIDTGDFEMVTVGAAIKDSGAIDVTLPEYEDVDDDTVKVQDNNRWSATYSSSQTSDHGTQTGLSSFFTVADVALH